MAGQERRNVHRIAKIAARLGLHLGLLASSLALLETGCQPPPKNEVTGAALSSGEADQLGDTLTDAKGGFSFRMPLGWYASEITDSPYQAALGPAVANYRANMRISREEAPLRFDDYVKLSLAEFQRAHEGAIVLDEADVKTVAGLRGRRWNVFLTLAGTRLWQAYYLFPGPGDDKVVVMATAVRDQQHIIAAKVDAAMKTLVIK